MGSSRWDVVVGLKYSKWSLANQTSVVLFLDCRQFCMDKTYGSAQWREPIAHSRLAVTKPFSHGGHFQSILYEYFGVWRGYLSATVGTLSRFCMSIYSRNKYSTAQAQTSSSY